MISFCSFRDGKHCGLPTSIFYYAMAVCRYRMPCAIMALATFMNPATLAPFT